MTEPAAPKVKNADLPKRLMSAVAMIVIAGGALWAGGAIFAVFVIAIGLGLYWEWWELIYRFAGSLHKRILWMAGGAVYMGAACVSLILMPPSLRWLIIITVIATDTGAYFTGRRFGGRKIAPSISPSKTWAGLYGGMAAASLVMVLAYLLVASALSALSAKALTLGEIIAQHPLSFLVSAWAGALLAVCAQAGDFFESWMKRRAGVKDSGALIPGHGGLFDRVDGLLPVAIAAGLFAWVQG